MTPRMEFEDLLERSSQALAGVSEAISALLKTDGRPWQRIAFVNVTNTQLHTGTVGIMERRYLVDFGAIHVPFPNVASRLVPRWTERHCRPLQPMSWFMET